MPCLFALQKSCAWYHNQVVGSVAKYGGLVFSSIWCKNRLMLNILFYKMLSTAQDFVCVFITKTRHEDL